MLAAYWLCALVAAPAFAGSSVFIHTDYCKMNCPKHKHTVCERNYSCAVRGCKQVEQSYDWRKRLVAAHNWARNNVAIGNESRGGCSEASDMQIISYDMQLEYVADCWANNFQYAYDYCRITERYSNVGQNIFKGHIDSSAPETIVKTWYSQVVHCNERIIDDFYQDVSMYRRYRHFTQLVNSRTSHIGCGMCVCEKDAMVVCNYGTGGNRDHQPVFLRGAPATNCMTETQTASDDEKYKALCGKSVIPPEAVRRGVIDIQRGRCGSLAADGWLAAAAAAVTALLARPRCTVL